MYVDFVAFEIQNNFFGKIIFFVAFSRYDSLTKWQISLHKYFISDRQQLSKYSIVVFHNI